MKLFQQMLVATAAASFIAPMAAQASDTFNIDGMNNYSRKSKKSSKKRIDSNSFINVVNENLATVKGPNVQQIPFEAGSFSDTTVADQTVIFTLAAADFEGQIYNTGSTRGLDATKNEAVKAAYTYTMNLNSSFSGDDNLYVRLKTGNASGWMVEKDEAGYLSSSKSGSDNMGVDKLWYQFPVGDSHTVWVGPKIENYYMHATTPSIYSPTLKAFTLGGNAAAYGASTNSGLGWAYNNENGFAVSSNAVSQQNGSSKNPQTDGFFAGTTKTSWATQIGYTQPQYAVSAMLNLKYNGWDDQYFGTSSGFSRSGGANSTNLGLRGWWRPLETGTAIPAISAGYDQSDIDGASADSNNTTMWFVGLNWADMFRAEDKIGAAIGQPQTNESETVDPFVWEAYYAFKPNDSMEYRTTVFGGTDNNGTEGDDVTGAVFQTTFKF